METDSFSCVQMIEAIVQRCNSCLKLIVCLLYGSMFTVLCVFASDGDMEEMVEEKIGEESGGKDGEESNR